MTFNLETFISDCDAASRCPDARDAQARIEALLRQAVQHPEEVAAALAGRTKLGTLEDLTFFRGDTLTLLHGAMPAGFSAAPHNHNLWSVIGVYGGQEDNVFFERTGDGLVETGRATVTAPGVLANGADVIHAICNPLGTELRAIHAYGGDLFATDRSNWDAQTHEETAFDWRKVASK